MGLVKKLILVCFTALAVISGGASPVFADDDSGGLVDDYTDDAATVVLASHWPDGKDRAYPVQVSHASGDWKVVLPEQGQEPDLTDLDNTDDFIPLTDKDTANEK